MKFALALTAAAGLLLPAAVGTPVAVDIEARAPQVGLLYLANSDCTGLGSGVYTANNQCNTLDASVGKSVRVLANPSGGGIFGKRAAETSSPNGDVYFYPQAGCKGTPVVSCDRVCNRRGTERLTESRHVHLRRVVRQVQVRQVLVLGVESRDC